MKILRIVGLLLAGLLAGGALMMLTNGPPAAGAETRSTLSGPADHSPAEAHPAAARSGYQLRAGEILRYHLRLQSAIAVRGELFDTGAGTADTLGIHFDGQLLLAIRESGPTQIRARAWLEGETLWRMSAAELRAQPGSALDEQLRRGAELRLTPDGRLIELVTSCARDEPAYGVLAHILASCQVAVPPGQGADWTAEEQSPVGRYLGHYQASPAGPGRLTLTKTRQFVELEHPRLHASSRDSVHADFDDGRGHLESLSAQQQLSVRLLEGEVYSAHTDISLQLLERVTGRLPAPLGDQAASQLFAPRPLADPLAAERALAGDVRLEELLAQLPETLQGPMDARLQLLELLAARLCIAPSEALWTVEPILSQAPGSEAEDFLIAALGAAGHREAGQALLQVAAARGQNTASLLSVLPAVGQLRDAARRSRTSCSRCPQAPPRSCAAPPSSRWEPSPSAAEALGWSRTSSASWRTGRSIPGWASARWPIPAAPRCCRLSSTNSARRPLPRCAPSPWGPCAACPPPARTACSRKRSRTTAARCAARPRWPGALAACARWPGNGWARWRPATAMR